MMEFLQRPPCIQILNELKRTTINKMPQVVPSVDVLLPAQRTVLDKLPEGTTHIHHTSHVLPATTEPSPCKLAALGLDSIPTKINHLLGVGKANPHGDCVNLVRATKMYVPFLWNGHIVRRGIGHLCSFKSIRVLSIRVSIRVRVI
jgi:hypothetical protein